MRLTLELYQAGEDLMRLNLRRRHPQESEEQIEERLVSWLHERPGAEFGDGPGKPVPWPRQH
jgi:hypothetical protein